MIEWFKQVLPKWFVRCVVRVNPCEQPEDSFTWRLVCTLFPECWCCAGLRGTVYGIIIGTVAMYLFMG